jgi:septation ring formation regulator EzrA
MQAEAQKKYQEKLTSLETRLNEVQTKLTQLQGEKADANRLVASPEVKKSIEEFRTQSADLRSQRRQIRLALREGIDALETRLLLVNLLTTPFLVGLFGLWFYRARRA